MDMKKVLVTGSLGTIGVPLTFALQDAGYVVFGCDLAHTGQERETYMRADVADYRELRRAFVEYEPDVVYHLAAEFGRHNGNEYYGRVWETNLIGTHNVLELAAQFGARVIFASTSEIYGDLDAPILNESLSDTTVLRQPNEYALSKWANERQIINYTARHDLEVVRLRFFNAYGPGETYHPYRSVIALFCHRALNGIPWEVYEGYHRTFMYVDDFVPTLVNAVEQAEPGEVYNVGGEDYRSVREVSDLVLSETGANSDLVTYLDEDVHNVTSKRPDNSKAKRVLGHDPRIRIEEGVPKTIDWMKGDRC